MEIVNRVAESAIETLDLAALATAEPAPFDLEPHLYKGLVLREREFRQSLKETDWSAFEGADVAVFCSADALVPTWAYMLVAARLDGVARSVSAGTPEEVRQRAVVAALDGVDWSQFEGAPVVLKGCGNALVPLDAFVQATRRLQGGGGLSCRHQGVIRASSGRHRRLEQHRERRVRVFCQ